MDAIDRKLLELLQADATLPVAELAQRVNLSQTPCWKRVQRMKEMGVIRAQVALCDPGKLGVGTTVFVAVRTNQHTEEWAQRFTQAVRDMPEVVEVYRMSGETDYLLRVVVAGIDDYDRVYKQLIRAVPLFDVSSSFAMEQIKYSTALPVRGRRTRAGATIYPPRASARSRCSASVSQRTNSATDALAGW